MAEALLRDRLRVVLVEPRRSGNVGSVARAMKNLGFRDLWLVRPRARIGVEAAKMAVHAKDVLTGRRVVDSLPDAIAGCATVVGTTGREGDPRLPHATLPEFAPGVAQATNAGEVALVFGPEDRGLSNAELGYCQLGVTIPASPEYPSYNLAQAVVLSLYAISVGGKAAAAVPASRPELAGATAEQREAMLGDLERALARIGFLSKQNPKHILVDVRSLFFRAGLTSRDIRVWRGIARQILWAAERR